jgi:hypothetical protein
MCRKICEIAGMRPITLSLLFSLIVGVLFAQNAENKIQFNETTVAGLSAKLTYNCKTDYEKVRAIFNWVTENISYNTRNYSVSKKKKNDKIYTEPEDTSAELKPLVEHVAEIVLSRRMAVCDGYTKLFKSLCDHAGIQNEIISGYGLSNYSSGKFRTNHTWNAVYTDSNWHLLDVTWASGFIFAGDFIHRYDNYYFFTPPQSFIHDHYPEDLRWTLIQDPPVPKEFYQAPFKYSEFIMQKVTSFSPSRGIIQANVGDKIRFDVESEFPNFSFSVTDSLRDDHEYWTLATALNNKASGEYVVPNENVEWLYLICNNEPVLRYKLNVKKNH